MAVEEHINTTVDHLDSTATIRAILWKEHNTMERERKTDSVALKKLRARKSQTSRPTSFQQV